MVTVLMAAYNGQRFIRDQIDSLLGQTLENLKIVISDDGSSDRTPEIIAEYAERYPEQICVLEKHPSSGSAQNHFFNLVSAVSEEYLMFCDQDDVWLPDKAEKTLKRMRRMEARWGRDIPMLVHTDLKVVDSGLKVIHDSMAEYQKIDMRRTGLSYYLVENNITGNTVMINRAMQEYLSYIPEECFMHDWWLGLLAAAFGRISYIPEPLVLYRQHEKNQLGAVEYGFSRYVKRIYSGEAVRENYRKMFRQAELFLNHYRDRLSLEQVGLLEHFISIPGMGRMKKIRTILKYRLFKSTAAMTLGQMFSI